MNAGILPLVMICAAFGFALYATRAREAWIAIALMSATALLVSYLAKPASGSGETLLFGLWATTVVLSLLVHLSNGLRGAAVVILALIAGVWMGLASAELGGPRQAFMAVPVALLFLPAAWVRSRGYGIAIKVMSSWLVAISLLAAMVSLMPTPGYKQDHME